MKPQRIVVYARVSTKDKGQDTRNQLAQLRDFCAKQDWTITVEYISLNYLRGEVAYFVA